MLVSCVLLGWLPDRMSLLVEQRGGGVNSIDHEASACLARTCGFDSLSTLMTVFRGFWTPAFQDEVSDACVCVFSRVAAFCKAQKRETISPGGIPEHPPVKAGPTPTPPLPQSLFGQIPHRFQLGKKGNKLVLCFCWGGVGVKHW